MRMGNDYDQNDHQVEYYLQNCRLNKLGSTLRGHIDGTVTTSDGMPLNASEDEIVVFREHPVYKARKIQLMINTLGLMGGRPYVDARLSRYAAETVIDWIGGERPDGSCATGRLQQTHAFPYLGRIAAKINQHVFGTDPVRKNADEAIAKDITRDGKTVNDLMREVSDLVFACKWCWIGVDAPQKKADGTECTIAEKEALKIRPYWQAYSPLDVVDWHFNDTGGLDWVKTKHVKYNNSDPSTLPIAKRQIKLWEPGKVTEYTITERKDGRYRGGKRIQIDKEEIPLIGANGRPLDVVPFVPVGDISDEPTAFDDLESINRSIMDLGSVDRANFFNASYPQLVLPSSVLQNAVSNGYAANVPEAGRIVIGFKNPILVDKDDATPSYLMPSGSDMLAIGERIQNLKRDMFEVVGFALEQESRQVASAESKAWDFLDVSAVMKSRAEMLEEAELKAVEISKMWDAGFKEWEPVYNRDFDIGNFKDEIAALVMVSGIDAPDSVKKSIVEKVIDRLDRIGTPITEEQRALIAADIQAWKPSEIPEFGTFQPESE